MTGDRDRPAAVEGSVPEGGRRRLRVEVRGAVQGVGFRPFVYRLATEMALAGWVINDSRGVFVEVEGAGADLEAFLARLGGEAPPRAIVQSLEHRWLAPVPYAGFEIRHSREAGAKTAVVLPDVATCPDCLAEVADPGDRRHRYPFTNCTNCGPRFTIVEALPYDRPNTTMRRFEMCPDCRREYGDPGDRRFHAQPNACPVCGPRVALWSRQGEVLAEGDEALKRAACELERGRIVAVKGLGGFLLMVDAREGAAVTELRRRKARPTKPLAVMVADVAMARRLCRLSAAEEALLTSPESPIVLLERRGADPGDGGGAGEAVAAEVAPGNPHLGVMVPYTPLHHLLLAAAGFPVVATSGNLSDEPMATDNGEALERLGGIADLFLVHDRPIARHADDSVAWILGGEPQLLRRARGYAPLPLLTPRPLPTLLAVGAHLKNSVALSLGRQVFLSQHIGDMETPQAFAAFERVIADFLDLYEAAPAAVAHDLHPDYATTRWAREAVGGAVKALEGLPRIAVQHHHAHLASCLAEHGAAGSALPGSALPGPVLGVTWDGTGYGPDGTVWGGELLLGDAAGYQRVASLRPFRLPGGEVAVKEPRRSALALLWELMGPAALERDDLAPVAAFTAAERALLGRMLERGFNAPVTTSAGRLFDAVAALVDLGQRVSFEGEAAMALEFAADPAEKGAYPLPLRVPPGPAAGEHAPRWQLDWGPLVEALLADLARGAGRGVIAARFHNALARGAVAVAREVGQGTVALTGGCFQNRLLTARARRSLEGAGFKVLLHRHVPTNDGGISLGQIAVAAATLQG